MANKYLITGGGNWSGSSWNTASNQATSNTTAPTTSDVAILDQYSGQVTIDTATCVCSSLSASLYANTITFTSGQKLTSSGAVTIGASATIAGTGELQWNLGAINITPTFTGNLTASSTSAKSIGTNLTVQGLLKWNNTCGFTGAYNIYAQGGYTGGTATSGAYWSSTSGNPSLYLQGGTIYGTIGGASSPIYLDGNISFTTGTTYQTDIRTNSTVTWISGTVNHTDCITRFISATPTLNTGNHVTWDYLQFSTGTYTLADDLYLNNFLTISGSPTINGTGYKVYVAEDVICYGVGTYSGTFAGIEMTGTGTFGSNTTPAGGTLDNTFTVNCNVIFNTAGTITMKNKRIYLGGGGTMTYTAGSLTTSAGLIFDITTGGYNLNLNNALTIPTTAVVLGDPTFSSNYTTDDLTINSGRTVSINNAKTLTVTTGLHSNGTAVSPVTIIGRVYLDAFVGNDALFETSSYITSEAPILTSTGTSIKYRRSGSDYDSWATLSGIDLGADFTIAFTMKNVVGGTLFWGSGCYLRYDDATGKFRLVWGANYSYSAYTPLVADSESRIVVTKATGESSAKFYVNGVLLGAGTTSGTTTGKTFNTTTVGYSYGNYILDEVVMFSDVKDSTWVATDYNSGNVKRYDSSETNIQLGYHMDDEVYGKVEYTGTLANQDLFHTTFRQIDASLSDYPIYTWYGTEIGNVNIKAITPADLGGAGITISIQ